MSSLSFLASVTYQLSSDGQGWLADWLAGWLVDSVGRVSHRVLGSIYSPGDSRRKYKLSLHGMKQISIQSWYLLAGAALGRCWSSNHFAWIWLIARSHWQKTTCLGIFMEPTINISVETSLIFRMMKHHISAEIGWPLTKSMSSVIYIGKAKMRSRR